MIDESDCELLNKHVESLLRECCQKWGKLWAVEIVTAYETYNAMRNLLGLSSWLNYVPVTFDSDTPEGCVRVITSPRNPA